MAFLQKQGLKSVVYQDDFCLANPHALAPKKTLTTAWLLSRLGFVVNWKKSSTHRSQKEEFLGFIVDTVNFLVVLPQPKVDKIMACCTELLERKQCSVRTLASLIGKLQNASRAILPAPLHFRHMQMASIRALARQQQNYAASMELPEAVLAELRWWLRNLRTWNGKSFLNPDPHLDVVITSDASLHGCGAKCQGLVTQGRWSQLEMDQHINVLQLRAAELALRSFGDLWQGGRVRLRLDNTTAVSQIVKTVKNMFDSNPRDLGVCSVFREHGYCSAPPRQGQRDSRFSEPRIQGQQQLETEPGNLSGSSANCFHG